MGYSGFVIVARTDGTRLDELACVDDLFVAVTDDVRAGGWRVGYLGPVDETTPEDLAGDLALETAAPAIALSVFDGDCAFAAAAEPAGTTVEFHLNEETVRELAGDDEFEPLNDRAAAGLLAWAGKAGLVAGPDRLAAALQETSGSIGDGILELTLSLGIAERPHEDPYEERSER